MRASSGILTTLVLLAVASSATAQQLREDSYRWFVGAHGGVLVFETQTQSRTGMPLAGAHALIMAKRAALQISIEEGISTDETSAYGDATDPDGVRPVAFDRLRKYSAILMAFPLRTAGLEPYFGVGFGVLHTVNTVVDDVFTSPDDAALQLQEARERGSTGFGSAVVGVQGQVSPLFRLFAHWQVTTAPNPASLLVGPSHSIVGGLRISLGSAKEGIRGGGY